MAKVFDINFVQLVRRVTPHFLRKDTFLRWIESLVKPVKDINDNLVAFRDATNRRLTFSAQVISLEKFLNDLLDPILKRIFISHPVTIKDFTYLHNKAENAPSFFLFNDSEGKPPIFFYNLSEIDAEFDYFVNIPAVITFDEDVVRTEINVYNQAGKRYDIVTF